MKQYGQIQEYLIGDMNVSYFFLVSSRSFAVHRLSQTVSWKRIFNLLLYTACD